MFPYRSQISHMLYHHRMYYVDFNTVKQHIDVGMVPLPHAVGPLRMMLTVAHLAYLLAGNVLDMIQQG